MSTPILLIDDEEQFALMLRDLLHENGYESEYCLTPKGAMTRLQNENFQLVITDYKMPEMDGAQFLEAIRRVNKDLPVIMISGLMNMPELIRVANIGVTLVLEKPFKTSELLENVARFVHAKTPEELSAPANEMEASEINFQPGMMQFAYPSPSQVLSDASEENKRFLDILWKNATTFRHIPCFAPKGTEINLVAREAMTWLAQPPDAVPVHFDLSDLKEGVARELLRAQAALSGIFMVDVRGYAWNDETRSLVVDWVKFIESSEKDLAMVRILYVFSTGISFEVDSLPLDASLKSLFAPECPVLLSLRERILDTACYINGFLTPSEKGELDADSLKLLLHYSWPGGYRDLMEILAEIRAKLASGIELNVDRVGKLLEGKNPDASSLAGSLDLGGYLRRRQREYINMHKEPGEDIEDTLLRMGIEVKDLDVNAILRDEILVYPDLLGINGEQV